VRDEDCGESFVNEGTHYPEEFRHLLRGENSRRLIKDEHASALIERLQNLNSLLHAHGQIDDLRVRIHPEAVPLGNLPYALPGNRKVNHSVATGLSSENDVLGHRKWLDQHEVLVNHADSQIDRVSRRLDPDRLIVDKDLSAVGSEQAIDDVHERGLAGTVFT